MTLGRSLALLGPGFPHRQQMRHWTMISEGPSELDAFGF